jgi:uncharacterized protein
MKYQLFFFLTLCTLVSFAQPDIPENGGPNGWVHDQTNKTLSPAAKAELESILQYERDSTSNQIAILIIESLNGASLEEYTLRVAEKWGLGKKGKDNGVLFFIALQERDVRIEVGRGLEGRLTDLMSSRINRNEVIPHFRQGNYDAGVIAGTKAIIQTIKGEYKNEEPVVRKTKRFRKNSPYTTLIVLIIIIAIAAFRRRGGGGGTGGYWSGGGGFIGGGGGFGGSSGSWGSGDFGGGGGFSGGGSSDSW